MDIKIIRFDVNPTGNPFMVERPDGAYVQFRQHAFIIDKTKVENNLTEINQSIKQLARLIASQGGRIDALTDLIKHNHGNIMMAIQEALPKAITQNRPEIVAAELAPQGGPPAPKNPTSETGWVCDCLDLNPASVDLCAKCGQKQTPEAFERDYKHER